MSTFQGALPGIDQVPPAAPPGWTTALLNTSFPQNPHRDSQAEPQPPVWVCVCVQPLQPSSMATPDLPHSPYTLTGIPIDQKPRAGAPGKPKSRPSVPSGALMCPDFVTDVVFPCLAQPAGLHLQQSLVVSTFSAWHPTWRGLKNWNSFLPWFWSEAHCLSN